jgi:uncharacterized membrane protein YfcA
MRTKRIDYKAGIIFAIATIPGSILGVLTTKHIPKHQFDNIFGIVLIILSIFLFLRGGKEKEHSEKKVTGIHQKITDKYGETYEYIYNMKYGIALSIFVGFFSLFWELAVVLSMYQLWWNGYSSRAYSYCNIAFYSGDYVYSKRYSTLFRR